MSFFWLGETRGWVMLVVREVFGWALILAGFAFFYLAYEQTISGHILYVWPWTIIGIFVFRGGIHLLKVAIAARVCQQTQDQLYPAPAPGGPTGLVRR